MKTAYNAEEIEDELNELKLRIAKMNARRNAQINLLQVSIYLYVDRLENLYRKEIHIHPGLICLQKDFPSASSPCQVVRI